MYVRIDANKPVGISSNSFARKMMHLVGEKKVGHSGTLDPMASGVLNLYFGGGTKFANRLSSNVKTYIAELEFNKYSNTLDKWGEIIYINSVSVNKDDVELAMKELSRRKTQIPPMFSAKKIRGKKLYDYAREGEFIERKPVSIKIYYSELIDYNQKNNSAKIMLSCSKGTYVRKFIDDLGILLGTRAIMTSLKRVKNDEVDISATYTYEDVENLLSKNDKSFFRPIYFSKNIPMFIMSDFQYNKAITGQVKFIEVELNDTERVMLFNREFFAGMACVKNNRLYFEKLIRK